MSKRAKISALLWAPAATGLILAVIFRCYSLYPFGDKSLVWCDMRQQVLPFWMQLADILRGRQDAFYSFQMAGGMEVWGVLFFFAASPFSLLLPFFEKASYVGLANVLTALKMMLCAFGAQWFFLHRHPRLRASLASALAICYAFSGYSLMYFQNSGWLDVAAVFPLLYLSLDRLERPGLCPSFLVWLTAIIVLNYYIAYAVLLFLLLAAAVRCLWVIPSARRARYALRLGCHTGLALALSAPVWLVSLLTIEASARCTDVFLSLKEGGLLTDPPTVFAFFFCSAIILIAAGAPWQHAGRKNRSEAVLFFVMLFCAAVDPINKMWHTGSYQAFPLRYGFIPVLLGLSLTASALTQTAQESAKRRAFSFLPAALAILIAGAVSALLLKKRYVELTAYTRRLWGDRSSLLLITGWAAFVAVAGFVLLWMLEKKRLDIKKFCALFVTLIVIQSFFSGCIYIGSAAQYYGWIDDLAALEGQIEDPGAYRVKMQSKIFDVNFLGALGYNNTAHYSSLTNREYLFAMRQLGYSGYWMEAGRHGGPIVSAARLSTRYTISRRSAAPPRTRPVDINGTYQIDENPLVLPPAIVTAASPEAMAAMPSGVRAAAGARMMQTLLGTAQPLVKSYAPTTVRDVRIRSGDGGILIAPDSESANLTYVLYAGEQTALYFDCFDTASTNLSEAVNGSLDVWVNGKRAATFYPSQRENGIVELGVFENEPVYVTVRVRKSFFARSFGLCGVRTNSLSKTLSGARTADVSTKDRLIKASCTAKNGEHLFLCVPYSPGWHAAVNGRDVSVLRAFDAFMAVPLSDGENEVTLQFIPPGLRQSLFAAALAAALLIFYALFAPREGDTGLRSRYFGGWQRVLRALDVPAWLLFCLFFCIEILCVFILPLLIWCFF